MNKTFVVSLMVGLLVLSVSSTDIYVPAMPEMARDLQASEALVGLTVTTFLAGMGFGTLIWGVFSDTYGRKPVLVANLAAYIIVSLIISISPSIWLILPLRFLQGVITSVFAVVCRLLLNDFLEGMELFKAINMVNTSLVLSPALAPVVGAQLSHMFGWRGNFSFSFICGILLFIPLVKFIRETNQNRTGKLPSLTSWFGDYFTVIRHTHYSLNNMMIMSNYAVSFAFITISSFVYINDFSFSSRSYALVLLCGSGTYFLGSMYAKHVKARSGRTKYIDIMLIADSITICSSLLLIVNCLVGNTLARVILVSLAFGMARFSFGLMLTPSQMRALGFFPDKSGHALGACFFLMFLSGAFGAAWISSFHRNPMLGLAVVVSLLAVASMFLQYISRNGLHLLSRYRLFTKK